MNIKDFDFIDCHTLSGYHGDESDLVVPDGVRSIAELYLPENNRIKSFFVPASVNYIEHGAFMSCRCLEHFAVDSLNVRFFVKDDVLYNVLHMDKKGPHLDLVCYPCAKKEESFVVPGSVDCIGSFAFSDNICLKSVNIPDSVQFMESGCFNGCQSLSSVSIPRGVEQLEDLVFCGCENLVSVKLHENVRSVGYRTFYNCNSLEKIDLSSLNYISDCAFENCVSLREAVLPLKFVKDADRIFVNCPNLKVVVSTKCSSEKEIHEPVFKIEMLKKLDCRKNTRLKHGF